MAKAGFAMFIAHDLFEVDSKDKKAAACGS
jgi:hypothetical protein